MGCAVGKRSLLGGGGRTVGGRTDLDSGMGGRVWGLDTGTRGLAGEEGGCKVEVIGPKVLHLGMKLRSVKIFSQLSNGLMEVGG